MPLAGQETLGWIRRTFAFSNTRDAWLARLGAIAWLAGLYVIMVNSARLSTGEALLVIAGWVLLLAVLARQSVRDMFGPVFFYEIIRLGRRPLMFRLRFIYVALVCGLLVLMYFSWLESIGYYQPGRQVDLIQTQAVSRFANEFFEIFVVVQYLTVILLTPVYVAGTIAVEKERKTLEFLLATDLRNREIIFGKLAARVTNLIMYVFAGLPIIAVLQLFGGIDPNLLLASFAATVLNVIGLAAVAVCMSTIMRRARDAIMLTYVLALAYVFGSLMLAVLAIAPWGGGTVWWQYSVTVFGYSLSLADIMLASATGNPIWGLIRLQPGGPPGLGGSVTDLFREFATFWGIVTVLMLGLSVWRLRAIALHQSYGPVRQPRKRRASFRFPRWRPTIGDNPVFWREVFVEGGISGGWVWRILGAIVVVLLFIPVFLIVYETFFWVGGWGDPWDWFAGAMNGWCRVVTGILTTLMFFGAAVRGAGAISGERDKDTWISLISTPLSADNILWGKWWGCILGLRRPFLVLVGIWGFCVAIGAVHPVTLLLELPMLFVLVSAFSWVGLYCSMQAKNSLHASIYAFFVTAFLAGGFWGMLGLFCGMPLAYLEVSGQVLDDLAQIAFGFTPFMMTGGVLFRSADRYDMMPFEFESDAGLGFWSLILGLLLWTGITVLFGAVCLWKFRRLTNRVPVYLAEELRLREEFARKAARVYSVARPMTTNGTPVVADPLTPDDRSLSTPDAAPRPPDKRG